MNEKYPSTPHYEANESAEPTPPPFVGELTPNTAEVQADVEPNPSQQDKIIIALDKRNPRMIFENVSKFDYEISRYEAMEQKLKNHQVPEEQKRELVAGIKANTSNENWESLFGDKAMRAIFASGAWRDFDAREDDSLFHNNVASDFRQEIPTPYDYATFIESFLDDIEQRNGLDKRKTYEEASRKVRSAIYGKQNEYYDQIRLLEGTPPPEIKIQESEKPRSEHTQTTSTIEVPEPEAQPQPLTPEQITEKRESIQNYIDKLNNNIKDEDANISRMWEQWRNSKAGIDYKNDIDLASGRQIEARRKIEELQEELTQLGE